MSELTEIIVPSIPPSIYFGGCAFGVPYMIGVVRNMKETWGEHFYKDTIVCGGSVGAVVSLLLVLGFSAEEMQQLYLRCAHKSYYYGIWNYCPEHILHELTEILNSKSVDIHELSGKFRCGIYSIVFGHIWCKSWDSKKELLDTLRSSMYIPFYCTCKDPYYILLTLDAAYGASGHDFPHKDDTLFIGVDQPAAEINRSMTVVEMTYPRLFEEYHDMLDSGYHAFESWDGTYKKKVGVRHPNYQMLDLFTFLKLLQNIQYYVISWNTLQICIFIGYCYWVYNILRQTI